MKHKNNIKIYLFKFENFKSNFPISSFITNGVPIIKITTYCGYQGIGEINPYYFNVKDFKKIFDTYFKKYLINFDINEEKFTLKKINNNYIKKEKLSLALSSLEAAIHQALLDILSKKKNLPAYKYLNNKSLKFSIPLYASGGMIFQDQNYDLLIPEIEKSISQGYFGWKFRPSAPRNFLSHKERKDNPPKIEIDKLIIFLKYISKYINNKFNIMIDFGSRLSPNQENIYLLNLIKDLGYFFTEEPFPISTRNYKSNFKNLNFALGESMNNENDFLKFANMNSIKFLQPDTNLISLYKIINLRKKIKNKNFLFHCWTSILNTSVASHVSLAIQSKSYLEYNIYKNPINNVLNNKSLNFKKGKIYFNKQPGLGITLNSKYEKNIILEY